jgi:hypothetical protein
VQLLWEKLVNSNVIQSACSKKKGREKMCSLFFLAVVKQCCSIPSPKANFIIHFPLPETTNLIPLIEDYID